MLKRAARFMTRNYSRKTGSMTGIFEEIKWEILQLRKRGTVIGPYYCKKGVRGKVKIIADDLIPKYPLQKSTLNGLSDLSDLMQVKTPIRKASLPKLSATGITSSILISAAELSDNCVSKFTSLLRARD